MAPLDNLTVTPAADDPSTVVAAGQIDSHTSSLLDDALAVSAVDAVVGVDLAGVTFVDSSGLRVLVRAHKRQAAGGGQLELIAPSEPVLRLLDIAGLKSELTIRSS